MRSRTGRTAAPPRQTIELADEATAEWGRVSLVYGQPRAPALPAGARAPVVGAADPASAREVFEAFNMFEEFEEFEVFEAVERDTGRLDLAVNTSGRPFRGPAADDSYAVGHDPVADGGLSA